jgi:hypothetical protein
MNKRLAVKIASLERRAVSVRYPYSTGKPIEEFSYNPQWETGSPTKLDPLPYDRTPFDRTHFDRVYKDTQKYIRDIWRSPHLEGYFACTKELPLIRKRVEELKRMMKYFTKEHQIMMGKLIEDLSKMGDEVEAFISRSDNDKRTPYENNLTYRRGITDSIQQWRTPTR